MVTWKKFILWLHGCKRHRRKFSRPGHLVLRICAPLIYWLVYLSLRSVCNAQFHVFQTSTDSMLPDTSCSLCVLTRLWVSVVILYENFVGSPSSGKLYSFGGKFFPPSPVMLSGSRRYLHRSHSKARLSSHANLCSLRVFGTAKLQGRFVSLIFPQRSVVCDLYGNLFRYRKWRCTKCTHASSSRA